MAGIYLPKFRFDIRLVRSLTPHELRHFLILLDYAAEGRDPSVVPAKKREDLRLSLSVAIGTLCSQDQLNDRLKCWQGLGLIEVEENGSILLTYLTTKTFDKVFGEDGDREEDGDFEDAR